MKGESVGEKDGEDVVDDTDEMLQKLLGFSSFGTSKYKKHESV